MHPHVKMMVVPGFSAGRSICIRRPDPYGGPDRECHRVLVDADAELGMSDLDRRRCDGRTGWYSIEEVPLTSGLVECIGALAIGDATGDATAAEEYVAGIAELHRRGYATGDE